MPLFPLPNFIKFWFLNIFLCLYKVYMPLCVMTGFTKTRWKRLNIQSGTTLSIKTGLVQFCQKILFLMHMLSTRGQWYSILLASLWRLVKLALWQTNIKLYLTDKTAVGINPDYRQLTVCGLITTANKNLWVGDICMLFMWTYSKGDAT